jgi:hypothetical protein
MKIVMSAFEFRDDNVVPSGYKEFDCHMIFDVKMDLTRKARLVAGGHQTDPPKESTYSSVVSRDSVSLTIAALNDLDAITADVQKPTLTLRPVPGGGIAKDRKILRTRDSSRFPTPVTNDRTVFISPSQSQFLLNIEHKGPQNDL